MVMRGVLPAGLLCRSACGASTAAFAHGTMREGVTRVLCRSAHGASSAVDAHGARTFIDRIRVLAIGGPGGIGCASYFRDTRVQRGPPDGGSGGRGGDVILRSSDSVTDLSLSKRNFGGGRGANGSSAQMDGRAGDDLEVPVPNGTVVHRVGRVRFTRESRMEPPTMDLTLIAELLRDGEDRKSVV